MISINFLAYVVLLLLLWASTWKRPYEHGANGWDFMRWPAQIITFVSLLGAKLVKRRIYRERA